MPVLSLLKLPVELIHQVALDAATDVPLGPPTAFYALHLTCRHLTQVLDQFPTHAYCSMFSSKFDSAALRRRFGDTAFTRNAPVELKRRLSALKVFRSGNIHHPRILETFYIAYFMMLEDDGQNFSQLSWAGAFPFIQKFIINRIDDSSDLNGGWPLDNEINRLAVALMWLLSSEALISNETDVLRVETKFALLPFVLAAFRYPCFKKVVPTSGYRGRSNDLRDVSHYKTACFGEIVKNFRLPSASIFAIPSYFCRYDRVQPDDMIPDCLPRNRAEANATGRLGPTAEDIIHFSSQCKTRFPNPPFPSASASDGDHLGLSLRHDGFWTWSWFNADPSSDSILSLPFPAYLPGTLTGRWQGSLASLCPAVFRNWCLDSRNGPLALQEFGRLPLYFTFREYFCRTPSRGILLPDAARGTSGALFPPGYWHIETKDGVEVLDSGGNRAALYEACMSDGECSTNPAEGFDVHSITDVIFTGQTEEEHAAAWGGYTFFGRVSLTDNFIVFLRTSIHGVDLFQGYILSNQNFVGRFQSVTEDAEITQWVAPFSLCKAL